MLIPYVSGARLLTRLVLAAAAAVVFAAAGPVEFGKAELDAALAARSMNPRALRIKMEVGVEPPETWHIAPGLITGGDLRGLMYGLLEAADQIRATGHLKKAQGAPALAVRGVRWMPDDAALTLTPAARENWTALFRTLARSRFNRFHLSHPHVFEHLDTVAFLSETAAESGIEFALGLSAAADGPSGDELKAALSKALKDCPAIRSVQLSMDAEPAMFALRAVEDAGRRLTVEAPADSAEVVRAAAGAHLPVRVAALFPGEAPEHRSNPFFWQVALPDSAAAAASLYQSLVAKTIASGAAGFEIDLPADQLMAAASADAKRLREDPFLLLGRSAYDPEYRASAEASRPAPARTPRSRTTRRTAPQP